MSQEDPELLLKLRVSNINIILEGLSELKHRVAHPVIEEVMRQCTLQQQPAEEEPKEAPGGDLQDGEEEPTA